VPFPVEKPVPYPVKIPVAVPIHHDHGLEHGGLEYGGFGHHEWKL
jgi:hypothetical protein